MSVSYDYVQTFYVDKNRVNSADKVLLTSIDLFFKTKLQGGNAGVSIWLCEANGEQPSPSSRLKDSNSYLLGTYINADPLGQTSTQFSFRNPVLLKTNSTYGVVIKFESEAYTLWTNRKGDAIVTLTGKTNSPSAGSAANFEGKLYKRSNSGNHSELTDEDLKFVVYVAKYTSTSATFNLIPKDYEFITMLTRNGFLTNGEWVYKDVANATGTLSTSSISANITGSGTSLSSHIVGDRIFVSNGTITDTLTITSISNSTFIQVDKNPSFTSTVAYKVPVSAKVVLQNIPNKELVLVDSNAANSAFKFGSGDVLIGAYSGANVTIDTVDYKNVDMFNAKFKISSPAIGSYTLKSKFANTSNNIATSYTNFSLFDDKKPELEQRLLSRSLEVVGSNLYGSENKSAVVEVAFSLNAANSSSIFEAPCLDGDELDMISTSFDINTTSLTTQYGITDYDTEVDKNGLATCKYISKKVSFAKDRYAEDIIVTIGAYRPIGTTINAYAKIHNSQDSEPFDDKAWTPLELTDNIERYSVGENDIAEYNYSLPQYPDSKETITANFTNQTNATILTSSDVSANIVAGAVVKIYDSILPINHEVFKVVSSNATSFTVNRSVTNVNIPASPNVDVLKYNITAWNNIANDNVARYFTSTSNQELDGFNTMQIKLVLLADSQYIIPKVEQLQVIGVSA